MLQWNDICGETITWAWTRHYSVHNLNGVVVRFRFEPFARRRNKFTALVLAPSLNGPKVFAVLVLEVHRSLFFLTGCVPHRRTRVSFQLLKPTKVVEGRDLTADPPPPNLQRNMPGLLLVLLVILPSGGCSTETDPPGHLKPLGSHMDPIIVDRTDAFPRAREFRRYVDEHKPLLVKGLLKETDCFRNWRHDSYIR